MEAEDPLVERFRDASQQNPMPGTAVGIEGTDQSWSTRIAGDP